jgi:Ser/Thr protein kinase RdoA (MazF antagonist)
MFEQRYHATLLLHQNVQGASHSTITSVQRLTGGITHNVYRFDSDTGKYIVKQFKRSIDPTAVLSKNDVFSLMQQLRVNDFPAPNPLTWVPCYHGHSIIVMENIDGRHIPFSIDNAYDVGELIAAFHIKTKNASYYQKKPNNFNAFYSECKDSLQRVWKTKRWLPEIGYLGNLFRYVFKSLILPSQGLPEGLTHHDLRPENILQKDNGDLVLLDYELCQKDLLINDLAHAILMFCFDGDEFSIPAFKALIRGYHANRLLNDKEYSYLINHAIEDKAELEYLSQHKLRLLGGPSGSPFTHERYYELKKHLPGLKKQFDLVDKALTSTPSTRMPPATVLSAKEPSPTMGNTPCQHQTSPLSARALRGLR